MESRIVPASILWQDVSMRGMVALEPKLPNRPSRRFNVVVVDDTAEIRGPRASINTCRLFLASWSLSQSEVDSFGSPWPPRRMATASRPCALFHNPSLRRFNFLAYQKAGGVRGKIDIPASRADPWSPIPLPSSTIRGSASRQWSIQMTIRPEKRLRGPSNPAYRRPWSAQRVQVPPAPS